MDIKDKTREPFQRNTEFTDQRIKEHLVKVLPPDLCSKWIEHFVFEKIGTDEVVVGYYGKDSIKEFNKFYRENVWMHVCSLVGFVNKVKIHKRKIGVSKHKSPRKKKNIKVAKYFSVSMIFVCIAMVIAVVTGSYIINRDFKEVFHSVGCIKINDKVRIIQITDLHSSVYGRGNKALIERVSELKPDIILYTGDCIDSEKKSEKAIIDICSKLSDVAPSYYIYGNNEIKTYYNMPFTKESLDKKYGSDDISQIQKLLDTDDELEKSLKKAGVKVLKNEMDTIYVGTTPVDIYGVLTSNPSAFWPYAGSSFGDYISKTPNNLKITAVHEPLIFEELNEDYWGDVMLCGHTHGGMSRIPVLGPAYTSEGGILPERKGSYVHGRYDVVGRPLIVSSGLDNNTFFRINNQPEITIIDINRF